MRLEDRIIKMRRGETNEWHKPKAGVYHASSIHDIYSGYLKPEKFFDESKFSDETLIIFEIGHMYHAYVQNLFSKDPQEVKIKIQGDGFIIIGRVDLILQDIPVDLKTCSNLPNKHHPGHESQIQCYLEALDAPFGYLTYIEKHAKRMPTKNFKITRKKALMADILQKTKIFHEKVLKVEANNKK